jgi:hypothetical protein
MSEIISPHGRHTRSLSHSRSRFRHCRRRRKIVAEPAAQ